MSKRTGLHFRKRTFPFMFKDMGAVAAKSGAIMPFETSCESMFYTPNKSLSLIWNTDWTYPDGGSNTFGMSRQLSERVS